MNSNISHGIVVILTFGIFLVQGIIDPIQNKAFIGSMNDFTQDFMAVAWKEDNFVFSPFR